MNYSPKNSGEALRDSVVAKHSFSFTNENKRYTMPLFSKAIKWEILIRGENHREILK